MLININTSVDHYLTPPDVHDVKRERALGAIPSLIIALVAAIAHGLNLYWFIIADTAPVTAAFIHIILLIITGVLTRILTIRPFDNRFLMLLFITTFFTGVFGAVGTVFTIIMYLWHARFSIPFSEWFQFIFPSDIPSEPELVYEDIIIGRDESAKTYSVIPFLEVLDFGTPAQKREALSRMTANFHPAFARAFGKALHDNNNMIRVQAATAITKIENIFLEKLMKLSSLYEQYASDPAVIKALAEHYDDYAFTGILDPERERSNRKHALKYYREYLKLDTHNIDVRTHIGRLLLRDDKAIEAADWFQRCAQEGHSNEPMVIWYMEALYAAKRFDELRRVAPGALAYAESQRSSFPDLIESARLWSSHGTPTSTPTPSEAAA